MVVDGVFKCAYFDLTYFSLKVVIMPRESGLPTVECHCILVLAVNSGYQICGHAGCLHDLIFHMRSSDGSRGIVTCHNLKALHS